MRRAEQRAARRGRPASAATTWSWSPPIWRLSERGVAAGDDPPVVDDDDLVGEAVGLLEVLRGQQQRGAVATSVVEHVPQLLRARGSSPWSARRGTAPAAGDEGGREVEPAAHAAGVVLDQAVGGVGERELARAARRPAARGLGPSVVQLADHHEVLAAREQPSTVGVLAARPMRRRTSAASRRDVEAGDLARPRRGGSVVRMRTAVVLPAPFGPSSAEDGAGGDSQVDASSACVSP